MNKKDLLTWGEVHHFPQLVIAKKDVVRAGRDEWQKLVSDTSERVNKAIERVEMFLERIEHERKG